MTSISVLTCFALTLVSSADPLSQPQPPAEAGNPSALANNAFTRLVTSVDAFAAIVDRVNEKHGRAEPSRLNVNFIEAISTEERGEFDVGLAPRAEFLRVAELVRDDVERSGLLASMAELAKVKSIDYPASHVGEPSRLNPSRVNKLLQFLLYGGNRAAANGDGQAVATYIATFAGISSLWSEEPGPGRVASVRMSGEGLAQTVMPLIVGGKLDRDARRAIAGSLRGLDVDAAMRVRGTMDLTASACREAWAALPKEVFGSAEAAREAWGRVDSQTRTFVESMVTGKHQAAAEFFGQPMPKIEFPLPSLESVLEDQKAALNWVIQREKLPMLARYEELEAMKASVKTGSEGQIASMASSFERMLRTERASRLANEAILVAIAIEDYRDAQGTYPEKLTDLVPKHLKAIPEDPALPGSEILYRREPITSEGRTFQYRLYSRGRNGADDGGSPATWRCGIDLMFNDIDKPTDILLNALR